MILRPLLKNVDETQLIEHCLPVMPALRRGQKDKCPTLAVSPFLLLSVTCGVSETRSYERLG